MSFHGDYKAGLLDDWEYTKYCKIEDLKERDGFYGDDYESEDYYFDDDIDEF